MTHAGARRSAPRIEHRVERRGLRAACPRESVQDAALSRYRGRAAARAPGRWISSSLTRPPDASVSATSRPKRGPASDRRPQCVTCRDVRHRIASAIRTDCVPFPRPRRAHHQRRDQSGSRGTDSLSADQSSSAVAATPHLEKRISFQLHNSNSAMNSSKLHFERAAFPGLTRASAMRRSEPLARLRAEGVSASLAVAFRRAETGSAGEAWRARACKGRGRVPPGWN